MFADCDAAGEQRAPRIRHALCSVLGVRIHAATHWWMPSDELEHAPGLHEQTEVKLSRSYS